MHLLYADEANVDPSGSEFFTYAGVAIPGDVAGQLSVRIDQLRTAHGYGPTDVLKFNTKERPRHISTDTHREIKRLVMGEAAGYGVKLFCSFVLHKIATSSEDARRNEINRICLNFNYFLNRVPDYGLVLIDTFQDNSLLGFLRQKFSVGLRGLPYSATYRLDRVLGFHLATIGSSNFCSLVDIVIGALRYSINVRNTPGRQHVSQALLNQLAHLAIRTVSGRVDELSIVFSPKTIRVASYLHQYQALHAYLAANGLDCEQRP